MLTCTSFYFECCQILWEQNLFFLLSRYCSNKISSNETLICFLWHFIGTGRNSLKRIWTRWHLSVHKPGQKAFYQHVNSELLSFATHAYRTPSLLNLTVVCSNINIKINFIFYSLLNKICTVKLLTCSYFSMYKFSLKYVFVSNVFTFMQKQKYFHPSRGSLGNETCCYIYTCTVSNIFFFLCVQ